MYITLKEINKAIADLERRISIQNSEKACLLIARLYSEKKEKVYENWTTTKNI